MEASAPGRNEPPLPGRFRWSEGELVVGSVLRSWTSAKEDRGDAYLARSWFEVRLEDGGTAVVYFDRKAKAAQPRWWLYTIST
ncbi:MAG: DUF6504 family protein [Vulcanimicrobiaceae bacterium]